MHTDNPAPNVLCPSKLDSKPSAWERNFRDKQINRFVKRFFTLRVFSIFMREDTLVPSA